MIIVELQFEAFWLSNAITVITSFTIHLKILFIWLLQIVVAALGIFSCAI